MPVSDRVPPQSLESERALLGALLLKPDAIHDVSDLIRPDSFYAEKHRIIFSGMRELAERGEPIDLVSLSERLNNQGLLERSGGRAYLAELVDSAPAPAAEQQAVAPPAAAPLPLCRSAHLSARPWSAAAPLHPALLPCAAATPAQGARQQQPAPHVDPAAQMRRRTHRQEQT